MATSESKTIQDYADQIQGFRKKYPVDNASGGQYPYPIYPHYPTPCPCCGRCPHCGRGGDYYYRPYEVIITCQNS